MSIKPKKKKKSNSVDLNLIRPWSGAATAAPSVKTKYLFF